VIALSGSLGPLPPLAIGSVLIVMATQGNCAGVVRRQMRGPETRLLARIVSARYATSQAQ